MNARLPGVGTRRFVDAWSPGARLVKSRRLRGGIGAHTHQLVVETSGGQRRSIVLRRYLPMERLTPRRAEREFRAIALVHEQGVPSPEALALDADGKYFGTPAMLLTYLPGRPLHRPHDVAVWTSDLAAAMHQLHAVRPDSTDLEWLPRYSKEEMRSQIESAQRRIESLDSALAHEAVSCLVKHAEYIEWLAPTLIHEDFWPGNTVWNRGRLVGVIDWANAAVGDPRIDLAQCRIDSHIVNGFAPGDALVEAYERAAGLKVPDLWFFDLFRAVAARLSFDAWVTPYQDAGITEITFEHGLESIEAFMRRSLESIPG